jgi:hypothetical protein
MMHMFNILHSGNVGESPRRSFVGVSIRKSPFLHKVRVLTPLNWMNASQTCTAGCIARKTRFPTGIGNACGFFLQLVMLFFPHDKDFTCRLGTFLRVGKVHLKMEHCTLRPILSTFLTGSRRPHARKTWLVCKKIILHYLRYNMEAL